MAQREPRNLATKEQMKQVGALDHAALVGMASGPNLMLSHLPVETEFSLSILERDTSASRNLLLVNDEPDKLLREYKLTGTKGTLRQLRYVNMRPANPKIIEIPLAPVGCQPKMSRKNNGGHTWKPTLFIDGGNVDLVTTIINQIYKETSAGTTPVLGTMVDKAMSLIEEHGWTMPLIAAHTIRFPPKFVKRKDVSFLGLPKGTKIYTKNGGQFEVVGRAGAYLDNMNDMSGHLILRVTNTEALIVAEAAGWSQFGSPTAGLNATYCAGANLMTARDKHRVLTEEIRLPFINPLGAHSNLLPVGVEPKLHVSTDKPLAYYENKDSLTQAIEDFMFG